MENKTPTDVIMECMEDFGESEPTKILVIYLNEDDMISWKSNDILDHEKLGMIEIVKNAILTGAYNREEDE